MCYFCCFSLVAFNICSLCLIFVNLINMCLGVFRLEFILFGILAIVSSASMNIGLHACICTKSLQSCLTLCDPMDCSPQAPLSMGFSRQEYWSRLPFPPPGDLLDSGIKPGSPASQVDSLPSEPPGKPPSVNEWLKHQ